MSVEEQQRLKERCYGETTRYMDNAKECLAKAKLLIPSIEIPTRVYSHRCRRVLKLYDS